jgi:hypothetical protein
MTSRSSENVYVVRPDSEGAEDEKFYIGTLNESRGEAGELVEMYIEPFEGVLEDLIGDNLMYFIKVGSESYRYSRFEQYPDCDEIYLDPDDGPERRSHSELEEILEEAERTIKVIREGRPIQKIDLNRISGPKFENMTRKMRSVPFGREPRRR